MISAEHSLQMIKEKPAVMITTTSGRMIRTTCTIHRLEVPVMYESETPVSRGSSEL